MILLLLKLLLVALCGFLLTVALLFKGLIYNLDGFSEAWNIVKGAPHVFKWEIEEFRR